MLTISRISLMLVMLTISRISLMLVLLVIPNGKMGDEKDEAEEEWNKFWYRIRSPTVRRIEYER